MRKTNSQFTIKKIDRQDKKFAIGQSYEVGFSAEVKQKVGMHVGDAIKFALDGDKLVLSYLGDLATLSRECTAKRMRRAGNGLVVAIAERKLPDMAKYNIGKHTAPVEFDIVDGNVILDLKPFIKSATPEPQKVHDFSKIVTRVKSFGALSDLKREESQG